MAERKRKSRSRARGTGSSGKAINKAKLVFVDVEAEGPNAVNLALAALSVAQSVDALFASRRDDRFCGDCGAPWVSARAQCAECSGFVSVLERGLQPCVVAGCTRRVAVMFGDLSGAAYCYQHRPEPPVDEEALPEFDPLTGSWIDTEGESV